MAVLEELRFILCLDYDKFRKQSEAAKRLKNKQCSTSCSPPSYAQIASPPQHGIKRTTSERDCLSPSDYCSKRSAYFRVGDQRSQTEYTPPDTCFSPENNKLATETPEYDTFSKANSGAVQRRLFASPKTGQLTPTRPGFGNRYVDVVRCYYFYYLSFPL